ncbi:hypothetical protein SAMN02799622_00869 [Methylobacterium sp. UNC378MF]|uniref:hypothetical protein n=1 Tax=Methylobacterium sp. UNC378MF TaxID=1502748 RepID=UPI00087E28AF|nr:hypothetical protein [Methylobacterium sp. UNC378MF]SDA12969.1 hypothetical protein SAMN02799622_00869 [Methylobacterium sp. UNC378MF]
MGKAADNERKKLKATWYNNLSIGLMLGGIFIPYLGAITKMGYISSKITSGEFFSFEDQAYAVGAIVSMVLAFTGARTLRRSADEIASRIEGD